MDAREDIISELKKQVSAFPTHPGVYLMHAKGGEVIYVGKAKNLRARVRSYFGAGDGRSQIRFLLKRICSIDTIITESEEHAFVLERDLIAKYKPRYNIRLKDDKEYLSVRVDTNSAWPRIDLVRRVQTDGAKYFGPFTFSHELRTVLEVIKKVVPLRTCRDTVFYNRQRPCLEYQIKRCCGPCCLDVDPDEYAAWVKQAISILDGKTAPVISDLLQLMEQASEELRFEDAAGLRDRITILENFGKGQQMITHGGENRDIFALYREERLATLAVLQVRSGRINGSSNYSLTNVETADSDIIESALSQFYQDGREIPEEIILPFEIENSELLQSALSERRGGRVVLHVPKRGIKFRLLGLAELNAREGYISHFDAEQRYEDIARALARMLDLRQVPRRIECVDISNLQGSDIVGGLVTFFDGAPSRQHYRKYKIKGVSDVPNDFASINEVVLRRLRKGAVEDDLPDLLVIDGGQGQLGAALQARDELGVDLDIVAMAKMRNEKRRGKAANVKKKPERIFIENSNIPIILEAGNETTHFLQRVRDEVHRFAITFHRKERSKRVFLTAIDEVRGIGPERKKRLLKRYGSVKGMKGVPAEELARTGRMSVMLAEKLIRVLERDD